MLWFMGSQRVRHDLSDWTELNWCWDVFPLYPCWWDFFFFLSQMRVEFCQKFFCVYWDDHIIFILLFANVVHHIDWFVNIELSLNLWNRSHLIMVHNTFTYCWIQPNDFLMIFASIFTELVCLNFHFCSFFVW